MPQMHARRLSIAVALTALLSACASAPTKFHTLDPVAPATLPTQRALLVPVRVESVVIPP